MDIAKKIIAMINACLVASLMLMSQASYAVDAGHAQFVNGNVRISSTDGQESILKKGDMVREGDTLTTATDASAQIKMLDGGLIAVRSDTKLKFDTFKFNGTQDGSERSFFYLFTGGFRAVTGLIGKLHKSSFHITTATATIGIRGTDHETYVVTAGSPMAAVAPIGTYNKVNWGETTLTTDRGTIFVLPNQMGYVSAADQMPELQPLNTNIFTVKSRPLAKVKASEKEARKKVTGSNTSKEKAVSKFAPASLNKKSTMSSTHPNIARIPPHIQGIGVPTAVITIIDPVTTINWGRWNDSINVTGPVIGNANQMETDAAALSASDINTYGAAQKTGTAPTNNPNTVGTSQNNPASQLLINDYTNFTLPKNSTGLTHQRSGKPIIP